MPLNPTVATLLQTMADMNLPPMQDLPPAGMREFYSATNAGNTRAPVALVQDLVADGVPVRVYRPSLNEELPCLVFFHGGGWVIGDLETHDNVCRYLALQVGCVVVAVDYRLAPEHPFPAALDDCYTATCWAASQASELGIDINRMAVGGDSAGGNLAATVCLKAKALKGPTLVHQLLVYPVTNAAFDTASYVENAEGYSLTKDLMHAFWQHYIGDQPRENPLISPLQAKDLSGMPPATVITAEFDPLRDEGEAFGERLKSAGVATTITRYDGMIHGFFHMQDALEAGREAMQLAAKELKTAFQGPS
jgi:acetyl esterase